MKKALTIAGSDSSGGAGIQADLKTFSAHAVYGMSVITAITAQNTLGVFAVRELDAEIIKAQIRAVLIDIGADAVKTGMLSSSEVIHAVVEGLSEFPSLPLVVDPVMVSKSGVALLKAESIITLKQELIPKATLVTPNIPEAEALVGFPLQCKDDCLRAALEIRRWGAQAVLIKGGHGGGTFSTDLLSCDAGDFWFEAPRLNQKHTHGTGCSLSASLAACLARGMDLQEAVQRAKPFVTEGIRQGLNIGQGIGPIHHFHPFFNAQGEFPCK